MSSNYSLLRPYLLDPTDRAANYVTPAQLGCQKERPSLYHLQNEMAGPTVPTLILTGDEDWPCLAPALLMKRTIPSAALSVMPNCGHTINLEAPDLFNDIVGDFLAQVDAGRWPTRDPRAMSGSITGIR